MTLSCRLAFVLLLYGFTSGCASHGTHARAETDFRGGPPTYSPAVEFGQPELPEVLSRAEPDYPDEARRAGVQGTVVVRTFVRADGSHEVRGIMKSIPLLDGAAMSCVRKWRFTPGTQNTRPVDLEIGVSIKFALP